MLRKLFVAVAVLTTTSTAAAYANGSAYVGAGSGVVTNTSHNSNGTVGFFRGMPLNVFVGYSTIVDPDFYFALELNGSLGTIELENKSQMKTSYGYGLSFLPGILLGEHSLTFAKLGIVKSRFVNVSQSETGAQFGFGISSNLTQNIELRGEYTFTAYGDVAGIRSPRQDAAIGSLVYRFD